MSPPNKQTRTTQHFIALLRKPRTIMMMVPASAPVHSAIKDPLPHLDEDDLIIAAGNSYFKDPGSISKKPAVGNRIET